MELKDRKRINNQLPKYETGRDDWSRLYGLADQYAITPSGPSYPTFQWNNLGGINPENVSTPNLNPFVSGGIKPNLNMLADQNPIVGTKKLNLVGNIDPNRAINNMDLSGKNLPSLNFSKINPDIEAQKMKSALGTPQSLPNLDKFDAPERQNAGASISPYFALGQWIAGGVGDGLTKVLESTGEMDQRAGTSIGHGAGFDYKRQNILNLGDEMTRYDKEMAGSFLTSPGKGLTMLFGRGAHERKVKEHMREAELGNTYRRGVGMSDYMAQQFYSKYGDSRDQVLSAKNGKDEYVQTSFGEILTTPDAKVEGQEVIRNRNKATAHIVPGRPNGDNHYAYVEPSDTIISNRTMKMLGIEGPVKSAAKALEYVNKNKNIKFRGPLAKQTDDLITEQATNILDAASEAQIGLRAAGLLGPTKVSAAKNGKDSLPGFRLGSNWWIDGLGVLAGLGQTLHAAFNKPKTSNIYASNPYESAALNKLASIRMNPYPIMRQLRDQERRNLYAINRAGGLSGAQKAFANIATNIGTQKALADANIAIQQQNNQYAGSYANSLLSAGQADRAARQAANQYDLEYYSKAHAARNQWAQMGLYNMLAASQQGYANQWKRSTHQDNMSMYRQDLDLRRQELNNRV